MATNFQIIQGATGIANPSTAILASGWTVNNETLSHSGCNPGTTTALQTFGLVVGRQYVFTYSISGLTSGGVQFIAGTTEGTYNNANGTFTQTLTVEGSPYLSFYSDGVATVELLSFYDLLLGPQAGITISFNETQKKWVSNKSHQPELYVKFLDDLFTFYQGSLWKEGAGALQNNFFGVQYSSQITFIFNQDYKTNKLWYNLRFDSTGNWYVAQMSTPPNDQFPNGMTSVLTSKNIKSIDGKLWADILRDMNDPNFYNITDPGIRAAVALFQGRRMQGPILIVTLQCDDVTPATIASIEAYYTDVMKSL